MPAYVIRGSGDGARAVEVTTQNTHAHESGRYISGLVRQGYALVNGQWKEIWPNPRPDVQDMVWRVRRPYGRDAHGPLEPNRGRPDFMVWGGSERMLIYTFNKPMYRGITHVEFEAHIHQGFPGPGAYIYVAARNYLGDQVDGWGGIHTNARGIQWGNNKWDNGYRNSGKLAINIPAGASIALVAYKDGGDPGDGCHFAYLHLKNIWWEGDDHPTPVTNNPR